MLRRIFGMTHRADADIPSAPGERDAADDRWFDGARRRTEIDVDVTIERARRIPVVRDALKVRSDSVSMLPFSVVETLPSGDVRPVEDHPVLRVLRNPNPRQTGTEFLACMVDDLDTFGAFFARPVFDDNGDLAELWRMEPERCTLDELTDMSRRVTYSDHLGRRWVLVEGEFWYIPMPPVIDGLRGRSAILDDGAEAIAVAIALQRYANRLFANDATPPFVFRFPNEGQHFKDAESKQNFISAWFRHLTGRNRGRPGVLEYGMEIQKLGLSSEEAQFLETRKELWLDICRLWRVPPHMVGIMDRATFSNIEHQSLEFVTHTLTPLIELIEKSIAKYLLEDPRLRFEFNVAGLLRGDIKTRYEAYALGRQWGWLSVNDILRMEGKNGIGVPGDRYVEPLNMVPVGIGDRAPARREGTEGAIAFLRESVARTGGRPRLEIVRDAA